MVEMYAKTGIRGHGDQLMSLFYDTGVYTHVILIPSTTVDNAGYWTLEDLKAWATGELI